MTRWQDWDDLVLGLWVFSSPWMLGYATNLPAAAWTAWLLGGGVMFVACIAIFMPRLWEEPINILLGVSLILSPWVLGFVDQSPAGSITLVAGVLVTTLAVWALVADESFDKWWRAGHHFWTR